MPRSTNGVPRGYTVHSTDTENSAKYRPHRPQGSKSAHLQVFCLKGTCCGRCGRYFANFLKCLGFSLPPSILTRTKAVCLSCPSPGSFAAQPTPDTEHEIRRG